jgi:glycosyltransferase involved in cell wall biosynthesis
MKRFGIRNVTVTPNGVNGSVFHPGAAQTRLDLPARYVLFVGTLEPRKNLDLLLRAWKEIKDEFKETWLVIVGVSGNVFRNASYQHPMERVCFLGYVDDEMLAGLYAHASLFVLPSQEEGFGLPALEAMASGTPILVSDGGALPEVVGEAGRIFSLQCHSEPLDFAQDKLREESRRPAAEMFRRYAPQHDITLTTALKECLSDAGLRSTLKEKGLRRAGKFSWEATAEIIWKSLNEI